MKSSSQFLDRLARLLGATTLFVTAWAQNQATLTPIGQWPGYPLVSWASAVRVVASYSNSLSS